MAKSLLLTAALLLLAGCWNGTAISFGDSTLGEQLIDLQRARDAGAITDEEFNETKAALLNLVQNSDGFSLD